MKDISRLIEIGVERGVEPDGTCVGNGSSRAAHLQPRAVSRGKGREKPRARSKRGAVETVVATSRRMNDPIPLRFSLSAPNARAVFLAGTFNEWNPGATALSKSGDGVWSVLVGLPAGRYEYRFVVDGVWQDDPLAAVFVGNPYGSRNSVIEVG